MGYWTTTGPSGELLQGDEPYDIVMEAFEQIAREYLQDWKRKPTLAELIKTVEVVLATGLDFYTSDRKDEELVSLTAKTKRRKKHQPAQIGDFFAIPMKNGQYAFGRILSDLRARELGMLIGIYDKTSSQLLTPIQLKGTTFMFTPVHCDGEGWKTWKWRIIGNLPIEPNEFKYPNYKLGAKGLGWQIWELGKVYEASEEEVRDLHYASLWSTEAIEEAVTKHLHNEATLNGSANE